MPAPKNYIKIQYPRKCNHCDYVANNPQMWHYHARKHEPIPKNQLCEHGCGQRASFKNTGGVFTCSSPAQQCPKYRQEHSKRIIRQWKSPSASKRKTQLRKDIVTRLHTQENAMKISRRRRELFGTLDPVKAKDFRHYARFVRQRAQRWAKEQGIKLGRQTLHVDHKLSILDAWKLDLPESIVNHPANLQIISAKKNIRKGYISTITHEELLKMIKDPSLAERN